MTDVSLFNIKLQCICICFSKRLIDKKVDPCGKFFNFACGAYVKSTIVHDRHEDQGFQTNQRDYEDEKLRRLLTYSTNDKESRPFELARSLFKICMNHKQIDIDGSQPLFDVIEKLGGWQLLNREKHETNFKWQNLYEDMLLNGFSYDYFLSVYLSTRFENDKLYTIKIIPPQVEDFNRGYYHLLPLGLTNNLIQAYFEYMQDFVKLLGANAQTAYDQMLEVLEFETKLQKVCFLVQFGTNI